MHEHRRERQRRRAQRQHSGENEAQRQDTASAHSHSRCATCDRHGRHRTALPPPRRRTRAVSLLRRTPLRRHAPFAVRHSIRASATAQRERQVQAILAQLETPFGEAEARLPAPGVFNIAFERPEVDRLVKSFLRSWSARDRVSVVRGEFDSGKTYALRRALRGRTGVLYLELRSQCEEGFTNRVASRLGLERSGSVSAFELSMAFDAAVKLFEARHPGQPVLVVVENLDTCMANDVRAPNLKRGPVRLHRAASALFTDL